MTTTEEQPELALPNCFVVMPFGRDASEKRWFKGWYEVVIRPAVLAAGYNPVLAAAEEQPGAINDEIRTHLAFDPMVVVDLGGMEPEEDPNPNVMYELGIRHALGLPLVMMAWEGQRLPFDVSNQRVISEPRDFLAQETNRKKLVSFIKAAAEGRYYKPMEAVGRIATIEAATANLGEDAILSALVQEVKDLRGTIASAAFPRHPRMLQPIRPTIKRLLRGRTFRKELYVHFLSCGGSSHVWPRVLKTEVSEDFVGHADKWTVNDWKAYVEKRAKEDIHLQPDQKSGTHTQEARSDEEGSYLHQLSETLIEQVMAELPAQPWPTGTHRAVREKLGISSTMYTKAVDVLIQRGIFKRQVNGALLD